MNLRWDVNELYAGFDTDKFKSDVIEVDKKIEAYDKWVESLAENPHQFEEIICQYLETRNSIGRFLSKLSDFAELSFSVNTSDQTALFYMEAFEKKQNFIEVIEVKFVEWFSKQNKGVNSFKDNKSISTHLFHLTEMLLKGKYMLDESQEKIISDLKLTGSSAWTNLHGILTSSLMVDYEYGEKIEPKPISAVRSLAFSNDPQVRKSAYDSELKSYPKIEKSVAACLNGIKGEVITVSQLRCFKSPLEMTLFKSRMDEATLEAMLSAIVKYLPAFRQYYKKKAEMLGKDQALPFYDIFAPVSSSQKTFSFEEAKVFIVDKFSSFSTELGDFAKNAFDNRWIDAEPRTGKVGGAFCANLKSISQSRILTNFTGTFNDVRTLAHELGHAYHGHCLNEESFLNSGYPMPLAETASIFCETIVNHAALEKADKAESLSILEADISSAGQVIVDIYSRYLFETEVFKQRKLGSLSVEQLKEIMINSQKSAYGDGLDWNSLHPYMWLIKPHYYSAEWNFYNFPYAFGLLFAKGLYSLYLKKGKPFVNEYKRLLSQTGKNNIADVALLADVNVADTEFWCSSLEIVKKDIERFLES